MYIEDIKKSNLLFFYIEDIFDLILIEFRGFMEEFLGLEAKMGLALFLLDFEDFMVLLLI
jgi:hypothetical protein